jgi:hypothetical protein
MFKEKIFVDNDRSHETYHADHRLTYWEKEQIKANSENKVLFRPAHWWKRLFFREDTDFGFSSGRIEIHGK